MANGQQIEKQVITSSGGQVTGSEDDIDLHWSLGEIASTTIGDDPQLTQGFQQLEILIDPIFEWPVDDLKISVYPNPTSGAIHLEQDGSKSFDIKLFDLMGQPIINEKWLGQNKNIEINHLPDQTYLLTITSGSVYKSIKILKTSY